MKIDPSLSNVPAGEKSAGKNDAEAEIKKLEQQKQNLKQKLSELEGEGGKGKDIKKEEARLKKQIARIEKQIQELRNQKSEDKKTDEVNQDVKSGPRNFDEYIKGDARPQGIEG